MKANKIWISYHEAGHAVMAAMFGYENIEVCIDEMGQQFEGETYGGFTTYRRPANQDHKADILIAQGGAMAECYLTQQRYHIDYMNTSEGCKNDLLAILLAGGFGNQDMQNIPSQILGMKEFRDAVDRMAEFLIKYGTAADFEVREIVGDLNEIFARR